MGKQQEDRKGRRLALAVERWAAPVALQEWTPWDKEAEWRQGEQASGMTSWLLVVTQTDNLGEAAMRRMVSAVAEGL